ncbi:MAG: fasciclin domain-containing protein [Candidatus Poseidoniaceae archaeon]
MQSKLVVILTALLVASVIPFGVAAEEPTDNITTIAQNTGAHNTLVSALVHTGLVDTLNEVGPFTVFAPTDGAFAAIDFNLSDFEDDYDNETLKLILLHHVAIGHVNSSDITDGMVVTMASGYDVVLTTTASGVMVNNATVTTADVQATNGVIHVIDAVIAPTDEEIENHMGMMMIDTNGDSMVSLDEFLSAWEMEEPLDNNTRDYLTEQFNDYDLDMDGLLNSDELIEFIASFEEEYDGPTFVCDNGEEIPADWVNDGEEDCEDGSDEGVAQGPPGEICYNVVTHTVDVLADQATCEAYVYFENYSGNGMDNFTGCYNMVSHAVSFVSQAACEGYRWTPSVSIAMTAGATGIHTSLVAALDKAELVATLSGTDNFTVFAPTDEAFTAAGIDLDTFVTDEEIDALADILLYHVIAGKVMSTDLVNGTTIVAAANGDNLSITVDANGVSVGGDGAMVTIADVPASNGVIHVIDKVLLPPADEPVEPVGPTCDLTVGIASSGFAFSPASATIEVGQTVCWEWVDSDTAHNVVEVDGFKSSTLTTGGITSGASATTVSFHHTFTENTTFYYACQPHIGMEMFGKIVVGDGGDTGATEEVEDKVVEETPGFLGITVILATLGAVLFARINREEE